MTEVAYLIRKSGTSLVVKNPPANAGDKGSRVDPTRATKLVRHNY